MRCKNKSQVTVFIIIGILMLLLAIMLFYINERQASELSVSQLDVPGEAMPVVSAIENCMSQVAKDGIKKMGIHGGYIEPREYGFQSQARVYEGNAVRMFKDSGILIPYWFHLKGNDCSQDSCEFDSPIPTLEKTSDSPMDRSVQTQLEKYIRENLRVCLGQDLAKIKDMNFDVQEKGFLDVGVDFADYEVLINVTWPLKLTDKMQEAEHDIENFEVYIQGDFHNTFDHALAIVYNEMNNHFLETMTRFLIFGYAGRDAEDLPPFVDSYFSPSGGTHWIKEDVKKKVKSIISMHVPLLQYYGSKGYQKRDFPNDIFSEHIYNYLMTIPSYENDAHLVDVDFDFLPIWEPYIDLNCNGQICEGESITMLDFIPVGIQRYRFYYHVSYPVLVSVHDPYALDGEGFTLQFMLEQNLRYNQHAHENMSLPISRGSGEQNLFSDQSQRSSGNITVTVLDPKGQPVPEAEIYYSCVDDTVNIGKTSQDGTNTASYPLCFGGNVMARKEGYLHNRVTLSTEAGEDAQIMVELLPKFELELEIMKKERHLEPPYEDQWNLIPGALPLAPEEMAIVQMTRLGDRGEGSHTVMAVLNGTNPQKDIELAPGSYEVNIQAYSNSPFNIPERTESSGGEEFTVPGVKLNSSVPMGENNYKFNITYEQLEGNSRIKLYAIVSNIYWIPEHSRDMELIDEASRDYSSMYREELAVELE